SDEACVDVAVADFFIADEIPGRFVVECEGKGLLDELRDQLPSEVARAASTSGSELPERLRAQATRGARGDRRRSYREPALTRPLVRRIHDEVRDATLAGWGLRAR